MKNITTYVEILVVFTIVITHFLLLKSGNNKAT